MTVYLTCMDCGATHPDDVVQYTCQCGGLLDVTHDLEALKPRISHALFDSRLRGCTPADSSGVWRFRELVLPIAVDEIVTRPEGNTPLYHSSRLSEWVGLEDFHLKHEGENPTGSFKDRGMTVGVTQARRLGARAVACASTGNTSASLAAYGAMAGLPTVVFVPAGKIAFGKLAQALAYGAKTLQVEGSFDDAMRLVQRVCRELNVYLLNSINPFRIEGQKAIVFEMYQQRGWEGPDWIVLPAGNLGNTAAFGKALHELHILGLITRVPRLVAVQAEGAAPFYRGFCDGFRRRERVEAETIATAIKIGDPVSYPRAVRSLAWTDGLVTQVSDQQIMDAKAQVDAAGIGCEPASASSVAGVKKLAAEGVIGSGDSVVALLTGHLLKDPAATVDYHRGQLDGIQPVFANQPVMVESTLDAVRRVLEA